MKKLTFVFGIHFLCGLALIITTSLHGQEVIGTAGDFHQNSNVSVSWTIGEPVIETYTTGNAVLTQGFQQPILVSVSIYENPELNFEINAFPNPTSDYLNVVISGRNYDKMIYSLFDVSGKLIDSRHIVSENTEVIFSHLPVAVYVLRIIQGDQELKSFRIIKQ
jgi:hypothetical protein